MTQESKKNSILTDDEGNKSSMRLMSLLALAVAIILALVLAIAEVKGCICDNSQIQKLILYFLVAAFVPKGLQKIVERL